VERFLVGARRTGRVLPTGQGSALATAGEEVPVVDRRRIWTSVVGMAAAVTLLTVGCSDDEGESPFAGGSGQTTTSEPSAGDAAGGADAYCTAEAALEVAPAPDSSDSAAVAAWAEDTAKPMLVEVMEVAPEELSSDLTTVAEALDQLIATGDTAALSDPGYVEAAERIHEYDLANCGWTQVDVTATESAFEGIPEQVPAGVTSFELTNAGEELHELRVFRPVAGASLSEHEILDVLAGPEEGWAGIVEPVGTGEYTAQEESGYFVAELTAGTYYAACLIPVGATSEDVPPPDSNPLHVTEGMLTQFTVS
jgi:hypothetical protein